MKITCTKTPRQTSDLTQGYFVTKETFKSVVTSLLGIDYRWQPGESRSLIYVSKKDVAGFEFMLKALDVPVTRLQTTSRAAF